MLGSEEEEDHCFDKMARFIILFFSFYYVKKCPFQRPSPHHNSRKFCCLLQGVSMSTSLEVPPASALEDPGAAAQEAAKSGATIPVWTCTICSVPYRKTLSKFWKP
jgi:hypothetical protein